jgi:hypothetical protein
MAAPKVLIANTTFTCDVDGQPVIVHQGERLPATHPLVKGRAALFEPEATVDHERPAPRSKATGAGRKAS